jgi:peptidoglycan hydrolase-like protein with peptidoglycan-binding domain
MVARTARLRPARRPIQECMRNSIALFAVTIGLALATSVCADDDGPVDSRDGWQPDNVRAVQTKLRDGGFYFGEIDGAYSSELAAALGRYQIRNGLPITGQLDVETSKALGARPAVATSSANDSARRSETWQRLRKSDQQFFGRMEPRATPAASPSSIGNQPATANTAAAITPTTATAQTPPVESASPQSAAATSSPTPDISEERLRDYVGAFVLAGLDPQVGAEAAFFADRVQYYDQGVLGHEKIRKDLQRYAARWPERRFWLAGDITVEPQNATRVRVTFPLRYELRNGGKHSSGKIDKTLVLEPSGDDLAIVAVNERKAE